MRQVLLLVSVLVLLGCPENGGGPGGGGSAPASIVSFASAFGGEVFSSPVKLIQHPVDDDQFYVVEQGGTVERLLQSDPAATRADAVDVDNSVSLIAGGELGLLGMAFDPNFAVNGEVFFSYNTVDGADIDSVLGRFTSANGGMTFLPAAADPTVLAIAQPNSNHNGGDIAFGPDGFLYYAMGDGGGAGDPDENGQDITSLLGTILRLDVSTTPATPAPTNPFVGSGGADEIYAFGLRNPWRMSFDTMTGELWVGDVGQNAQEEIDRIVLGGNYGWDCFEGVQPFVDIEGGACVPGEIAPEVVQSQPGFRSITGGYVYRGSAIPELQGAYVYGDFINGHVRAFYFNEVPTRNISLSPPSGLRISSFAQDRAGELYVIDYDGNPSILKIVPAPVP